MQQSPSAQKKSRFIVNFTILQIIAAVVCMELIGFHEFLYAIKKFFNPFGEDFLDPFGEGFLVLPSIVFFTLSFTALISKNRKIYIPAFVCILLLMCLIIVGMLYLFALASAFKN